MFFSFRTAVYVIHFLNTFSHKNLRSGRRKIFRPMPATTIPAPAHAGTIIPPAEYAPLNISQKWRSLFRGQSLHILKHLFDSHPLHVSPEFINSV
jgi:hypothetical protein